MASTIARPAAGPSRIATATARFSSITGDVSALAQDAVQPDDLVPVGRRRGRRPRRGLPRSPPGSHKGPRSPRGQRPLDQPRLPRRSARGPRASGPARRAGSIRPTGTTAPRAATPAAASARAVRRASGSGSRSTSSRPSRIASADRSCRVSERARRSGVALVEHQVDHAQHGVEPLRQFRLRSAPGTECARRGSLPSRGRSAAPASAPASETPARSLRSSGRRPRAASARSARPARAPDGSR